MKNGLVSMLIKPFFLFAGSAVPSVMLQFVTLTSPAMTRR